MGKYFFFYAVDTVDNSGHMWSYVMIVDHEELLQTISDARGRGESVTDVILSMYDDEGRFIKDRDVTSYVNTRLSSVSNHKDIVSC